MDVLMLGIGELVILIILGLVLCVPVIAVAAGIIWYLTKRRD